MQKYTCQHRKVSDDGRIICSKIALGDNQVSPNLCRDCPAKACNCDHLRFSLQKLSLSPIIVRWGNGHTEVWDDQASALSFLHSACSLKALPISSPRDCMGCALREGYLPQEEIQSVPQEVVVVAQALRPGSGQAQDNVIPFDLAQGKPFVKVGA